MPQRFSELAERTRARIAISEERQELEDLKLSLSVQLWQESLESLFKFHWLDVSSEQERAHA